MKDKSTPKQCDVCRRLLRGKYFVVFNQACCSDACVATLYDREYDLPSGTTLNEMLHKNLTAKHAESAN